MTTNREKFVSRARASLLVGAFVVAGAAGCNVWPESRAHLPDGAVVPASSSVDQPKPERERATMSLRDALAASRDDNSIRRLAGIEALGGMGNGEAARTLNEIAMREGEVFQAAAVLALGRQADWNAVRVAANDRSFRVRQAAAVALAGGARLENVAMASALLADSNGAVQKSMIESLDQWPLEMAGPLLLSGVGSRHYATRVAARDDLARRWPTAETLISADLQPLIPPHAKIAELRRAWAMEFGDNTLTAPTVDSARNPAARTNNPNADQLTASEAFDVSESRGRLASDDKHARLQAAASLARNGYESGNRALESLSFDLDPEIRRETATVMGSLADPLYFASLVRLLDDLPAIQRAALRALELCAGGNMADDEQRPPANADQAAERWKAWYLRGGKQ